MVLADGAGGWELLNDVAGTVHLDLPALGVGAHQGLAHAQTDEARDAARCGDLRPIADTGWRSAAISAAILVARAAARRHPGR